jgi:hypothetical protein
MWTLSKDEEVRHMRTYLLYKSATGGVQYRAGGAVGMQGRPTHMLGEHINRNQTFILDSHFWEYTRHSYWISPALHLRRYSHLPAPYSAILEVCNQEFYDNCVSVVVCCCYSHSAWTEHKYNYSEDMLSYDIIYEPLTQRINMLCQKKSSEPLNVFWPLSIY